MARSDVVVRHRIRHFLNIRVLITVLDRMQRLKYANYLVINRASSGIQKEPRDYEKKRKSPIRV